MKWNATFAFNNLINNIHRTPKRFLDRNPERMLVFHQSVQANGTLYVLFSFTPGLTDSKLDDELSALVFSRVHVLTAFARPFYLDNNEREVQLKASLPFYPEKHSCLFFCKKPPLINNALEETLSLYFSPDGTLKRVVLKEHLQDSSSKPKILFAANMIESLPKDQEQHSIVNAEELESYEKNSFKAGRRA